MIDEFIADIINALESIDGNSLHGNHAWTVAVKKKLIDVAEKHKLGVNCSLGEQYKHNDNREWLYDLIMFAPYTDVFGEVYLICESEWLTDFDEIVFDFEKMLFTRSLIRLMVYSATAENYTSYKNRLINEIELSKSCLSGDIYLFAIYNLSTSEFKVEKYVKK